MENYQVMTNEFAQKHGVTLKQIEEPEYKFHFIGDKTRRWVFKMILARNGKSYTFDFGQSISNGCTTPEMYDVLVFLTKYDIGSYADFLSEFGYPNCAESKRVYNGVKREYKAVNRLFGDIMDELQEIQ